MIILKRLNGVEFAINSDLIETIEENPDTTIHMTNKHFYIVQESKQEIIDLILFLASEKGQFINGENIMIDGGRNAMKRWS